MSKNSKSSAHNNALALYQCKLCYRYGCQFLLPYQGDPWKGLWSIVQKADCNMYKNRKMNLDRYFQYGILMFTVNAAVLMDSYKWVTKYAPYSIIAKFCDNHEALRMRDVDSTTFIPYNTAAVVVGLWIMSLVLTSASIMLCHLGQQWLEEFANKPQFSPKSQLAFRQIHYDSLLRWNFFNKCNLIALLLPISAAFSFTGLIVLLWQLNLPDAYVFLGVFCILYLHYLVTVLHPLYRFFTAQEDGLSSELSPYRSPSSWFFFKHGNHLLLTNWFGFISYWKLRNRSLSQIRQTPLLPIHSSFRFRSPVRTKSIDWLEQDCSLFMKGDSNNAQDIDVPLANALIWIDSNPTIEKTTKIVVSVYHCISDLKMSRILPYFNKEHTRSPSGLAGIFSRTCQQYNDVDDPTVTAFVMKNWLELHVNRLPELRIQLNELRLHRMNVVDKRTDYAYLGFPTFDDSLLRGYPIPSKMAQSLLSAAKNRFANGVYISGTFKLIYEVLSQFRDHANKQKVNSVYEIFGECKHFADSFPGSGLDEQQARRFVDELGGFLSCAKEVRPSSPHLSEIWDNIITVANEVYDHPSYVTYRPPLYDDPLVTEPVDPVYSGT